MQIVTNFSLNKIAKTFRQAANVPWYIWQLNFCGLEARFFNVGFPRREIGTQNFLA